MKKSNIGDFFLNEAHPYSGIRTIKMSHVVTMIAVLSVVVFVAGAVLEKRGEKEREASQVAKQVRQEAAGSGVERAAANEAPTASQGGYLSLQSMFGSGGGRPGFTGRGKRELSASQLIKRGASPADVLPVGTQIPVQLVGKVESMDSSSPVTAVILRDVLSPVQALVIPRGTKVIGNGQLDDRRERLQVHFHTLVFPEGEQYGLSGLATMLDGSSGLEGRYSSGEFRRNVSQFVGTFIGGLAQGMKDRTTAGQIGIPFEPGSLKNGVLNGVADSSLNYAKSSSERMGQSSASIEVASGVQFVLYLEREFHQ